ncbi:unnamed protein product [Lepeophtheirus salmonis]|uniref:(salmon louse) hypothetical protein n=1 Tax=Lepeophtheirus salmonis TaxID=72036 RepID=A0A817FE79_LEPSM|nr:unnamed protein product [Lepeophtheirus salmonis]CAG9477427.1 unnamed protein product [Lepeophtheirus salmonis]
MATGAGGGQGMVESWWGQGNGGGQATKDMAVEEAKKLPKPGYGHHKDMEGTGGERPQGQEVVWTGGGHGVVFWAGEGQGAVWAPKDIFFLGGHGGDRVWHGGGYGHH